MVATTVPERGKAQVGRPSGGRNHCDHGIRPDPSRLLLRAASPALTAPDHWDLVRREDSVRHTAYTLCMASKTERLSLRLTPEQDAVLRRAAEARGESANDFVLRHAVEAAEMELADRRVFVVDDAAWNQLQDLLSAPPALPAAMVKLLSNPSVLERPA
jgi:uncharacterized protein (DUF1778 family)